jgi:hypothetical protein
MIEICVAPRRTRVTPHTPLRDRRTSRQRPHAVPSANDAHKQAGILKRMELRFRNVLPDAEVFGNGWRGPEGVRPAPKQHDDFQRFDRIEVGGQEGVNVRGQIAHAPSSPRQQSWISNYHDGGAIAMPTVTVWISKHLG